MVLSKYLCVGRAAQDPKFFAGEGKSSVARVSLAVDRAYKREGEPETDFFNFVGFGKTAEFVEKYVKKGTKVIVEARPQVNKYTDKDGGEHSAVEFVIEGIQFAESKKSGGSASAADSGDAAADTDISAEALAEAETLFV